MDAEQQPKGQQINIMFPERLQGGAYANNMNVLFTREEFILDFLLAAPPVGTVTARVIVSPGHMKRILGALTNSVQKYEAQHGQVEPAQEPPGKIQTN